MRNRVLRFLVLSGLSFVANFAITVGLHELLGVSERLSFAVALGFVLISSFLMMRYYIFDGRRGSFVRQLRGYGITAITFRTLEYLTFLLLLGGSDADYRLVVIVVLVASAVMKFVVYGFVFESQDGLDRP